MRYILGFLGFIVLIIFVIVLLVRGGDNENNLNLEPVPRLADAASTDAAFTYIEDGPIVSNEEHHEIRIQISRFTRTIEVVQGYENKVVARDSFPNNQPAFEQFLSALDRAGYTIEGKTKFETEEGLCPTGERYIFESNQFNESFRRWSTTCDIDGSFGGSIATVRRLFRDQIPEYGEFISDTRRATDLNL